MPFYPEDVKPITEPNNDLEPSKSEEKEAFSDIDDLIDGRPQWYDPIITETFMELKLKFEKRFFKP